MNDRDLPRQYVVAPNGVPSPLLTHMMNKRRNDESKAPCANQCEANAFKIEARMSKARITELESTLRRQHEAIKQLREALEEAKDYAPIGGKVFDAAKQALADTEGI